jgi:hypothetical protein
MPCRSRMHRPRCRMGAMRSVFSFRSPAGQAHAPAGASPATQGRRAGPARRRPPGCCHARIKLAVPPRQEPLDTAARQNTRDDADESEGWSERSVATDQSRAATSPTDRLLPNRPPLHRDRLVTWRAPTRRCKPIAFRPRADVPVEKTSRATTPAPDAATRRAAIGHHAAYHRRRSSAPAHGIPCRGDQIALDFVASRSRRTSRITRVRRA